jgi:hypothetical protein
MNMKKLRTGACIRHAFSALAILTLSNNSTAATVLYEIEFTGELTSITSSAPFWSGIVVGTPFTVSATYDNDPTVISTAGPTSGSHRWAPNLHTLTASFGNYTFIAPALQLQVRNNLSGQDGFILGNAGGFSSNGLDYVATNAFQASLIDLYSTYNPITNTTVDAVGPFDLAVFNAKSFGIYNGTFNGGADTASVGGSITGYTFSSTPIPEPSSSLLLGLGAIAAIASLRRRSTNESSMLTGSD